MLFAQGNQPDVDVEQLGFMLGFVCVVLAVVVVVMIFFLRTLHKLLGKCRERNRTMSPGLVWLNFVPCLNFVWQFLTVIRVDESLRNEFRDRGVGRRDESYGKLIGILACVLNIVANVVSKMGDAMDRANGKRPFAVDADDSLNPFDYATFALLAATLVCFVIYWVKMAHYSRKLDETESGPSDDFDSRGTRPRRIERGDQPIFDED